MKEYRGNPENRHYDGLLGYITPEDDHKLIKECTIQTFRGKAQENKQEEAVHNAVRLIHKPTGIRVSSNLGVSQAVNKEVALEKLRKEINKLLTFKMPRKETQIDELTKKERLRNKRIAAEKRMERKSFE